MDETVTAVRAARGDEAPDGDGGRCRVIVVDASVLTGLYLDTSEGSTATVRRVLGADSEWYAPGHQPVEFLNSPHGLVLGQKVSADGAEAARKLYGL